MTRIDSPAGRWNAAAIGALIVIVGTLGYHQIFPMPDAAATTARHKKDQADMLVDTQKLMKEVTSTRLEVAGKLWQATPEEIAAQAMATVDKLATENMIKVQAFRPQKTITINEIVRYPYTVVLQGSFPKVVGLIHRLQDPGTNLAVTSVQLAAADGASDTVTSTIGLAAFSGKGVEEDNGK